MKEFRPDLPFTTVAYLLTPTYETIKGVPVKKYLVPTDEDVIHISFKTFGGTESTKNDLLVIEDTANVETWYDPKIKSDYGIRLTDDDSTYEILGEPEDINKRHQFLKFKVKRIKGGV